MESIQDFGVKIKQGAETAIGEWGLLAVVFLVGIASFGLGRFSALEQARPPVSIVEASLNAAPAALAVGGLYEASKTGSVYYYPWCSGAAQIAAGNARWFSTAQAAQTAGYRPAKNCKGLPQQS